MEKGRIHSLESFGTVDGPGVRFVVFLQGCPMRCQYCHNPDTWQINAGEWMSTEEVLERFQRNKEFYTHGGITVTGGEPMLQMDFVTELFEKAQRMKIHTCLDTSGICFDEQNSSKATRLLAHCDLVMLDIKHMDELDHQALTGHSNRNILAFARYLSDQQIPVWIRHVYLNSTYNQDEALYRLGQFIKTLKNVKGLDVLPYHTMGKSKYDMMNLDYPLKEVMEPTAEETKLARSKIIQGMKKTS